jgi:hypothetical protein
MPDEFLATIGILPRFLHCAPQPGLVVGIPDFGVG